MARSRNIKPGFFKNEDLAECSAWARLCFAGLWTLADREGRLEDRAKRIKGELFPFDSIEAEPLIVELERWKFIRRYTVKGERFIQIVNFVKHQVPHGTEKDSLIPDENGFLSVHERGKNGYITGNARLEGGSLTVKQGTPTSASNSAATVKEVVLKGGQNTLIPDSRFLIPDSNTPLPPEGGRRRAPIDPDEEPEGFAPWYALYRRKDAKRDAIKAWRKLNPDHLLQATLVAALANFQWSADRNMIPLPATWLNKRRWEDEGVTRAATAGSVPDWCRAAGFANVFEAENSGCWEHTANQFRDGRRLQEAASE